MKMNKLLLTALAISAITTLAIPHNQISRTLDVNTELISAEVGDGLSLSNGVLSADITIEVPTRLSELTNDVGFVTETITNGVNTRITAVAESVPTAVSQLTNDVGYITEADLPEVPTKTSDLINDSGYVTESVTNALSARVTAVAESVPTAVSQLTNDVGYITEADLPEVPTKTSDLVNDSGYVTESVTNALSARVTAVSNAIPSLVSQLVNDMDYITDAELPTQVSQLSNDVGYVTETVTNGVSSRITTVADTIPTNNTQLINGAGYITDYKESGDGNGWINYNSAVSASEIGVDFYGIAPNQMLGWRSITTGGEYLSTNYAGGMMYRYGENGNKVMYPSKPMVTGFAKTYTLAITDDIPNAVSQLTNDTGFITSADIPSIPTKVSELTNDKYYVTKSVTNTLSVNVRNLETRVTAISNMIPNVTYSDYYWQFPRDDGYIYYIGPRDHNREEFGLSMYYGATGVPTEYPLYTYQELSNLIVRIASSITPTSDYEMLSAIYTAGTSWANIGRPIYGGKWEISFTPTSDSQYQCVVGCADAQFLNRYYPLFLNRGNYSCGYGYSYNSAVPYDFELPTVVNVWLLTTTPIFKANGTQITLTRSDGSAPTSIPADVYVGARNVSGGTPDLPFVGSIKYIKILDDNDNLIMDLQPARKISTNTKGLLDRVSNQFYPSITEVPFQ